MGVKQTNGNDPTGQGGIVWTNEKRRLGDLTPWPRNPRQIKKAEAARLAESLDNFGQVDVFAVGPDGELYNGHQRLAVWSREHGPDFEVDVRVSSRPLSEKERERLTVLLHRGAVGSWDFDLLANEFDVEELIEWGFDYKELGIDPSGVERGKQPNPRNLPLDVIYTLQMADCTCCLAVQAGLKYGIQSAHYRLCPYTYELTGRHEVAFVDNDYFKYDHAAHLEAVKLFAPKYATVRDIMTEAQCETAGITYHSLEQVLEWADELAQYAQNVIVIPKYDCIDAIPERFMLGYSVPTSHGGTPLSVDLFRGRRVHLLGGSWRAQLDFLAALGDDVVSLDNNYIHKQAGFGSFVYPDGSSGGLTEDLHLGVANPRYTAAAISFGCIASAVNQFYYGSAIPAE